jgi:hypothetical protein
VDPKNRRHLVSTADAPKITPSVDATLLLLLLL